MMLPQFHVQTIGQPFTGFVGTRSKLHCNPRLPTSPDESPDNLRGLSSSVDPPRSFASRLASGVSARPCHRSRLLVTPGCDLSEGQAPRGRAELGHPGSGMIKNEAFTQVHTELVISAS